MAPVRGVGETENWQWLFSDRADTTSALEFRDEGHMALLSCRNDGRNKRQTGNDHFEICPQLKRFTYKRSKDKRSNDKRSNDQRPKDKSSNDKRSKDNRLNWTQGRIGTQG
jgi:hypothetical protein